MNRMRVAILAFGVLALTACAADTTEMDEQDVKVDVSAHQGKAGGDQAAPAKDDDSDDVRPARHLYSNY